METIYTRIPIGVINQLVPWEKALVSPFTLHNITGTKLKRQDGNPNPVSVTTIVTNLRGTGSVETGETL